MYYSNADELLIIELEDFYGAGCVTRAMLDSHRGIDWRQRAIEINEKYAEVNKAAKSFARENKLCALSGSGTPPQVRWAQSIRAERFQSKSFTDLQKNMMAKIGDAVWWIDTRGFSDEHFGRTLQSHEVSNIVQKTEKKKVVDRAKRSAQSQRKKAEMAYAVSQEARIAFIVSLKDQFALTEKTQYLGDKLGELSNEDGEYRVFYEDKSPDMIRVLFNKEHYLVKLASEQIAKFKSF